MQESGERRGESAVDMSMLCVGSDLRGLCPVRWQRHSLGPERPPAGLEAQRCTHAAKCTAGWMDQRGGEIVSVSASGLDSTVPGRGGGSTAVPPS